MEIIMYSTSWCTDCHNAKALLKEMGLKYKEIDIEEDEEAMEFVEEVNDGKRRVPTFKIDGEIYSNPPLEELEDILA